MAIGAYFPATDMTAQKYREVIKRLEAAGAGVPKGRRYHAAFGDPGKLEVFDVWDSQETLDAFGEVLFPILAACDVHPAEPVIAPIENIIIG